MLCHHTPLCLFVIKRFHGYGHHHHPISNGLRNSAQIVVDMLLAEGHRAKLVDVIDANGIDRVVAEYRPDRVVLEAIWVTPAKLRELKKLWPKVKWTVRIHSEVPFLANEGVAIDWIHQYASDNVEVAFNSKQALHDLNILVAGSYLPNFYPLRKPRRQKPSGKILDVGCFGAVRPLKNQLVQACAAVRYARIHSKHLRFHMNGTRQEQGGNNNLKNISALIEAAGFELVLHPWLEHHDFLELIGRMDFCLQVSLTETFCIVAADAVSMGVPLVGSEEIPWLPEISHADPSSAQSIVDAMNRAGNVSVLVNAMALKHYLKETIETWNRWLD